jgi:hypothetical protein
MVGIRTFGPLLPVGPPNGLLHTGRSKADSQLVRSGQCGSTQARPDKAPRNRRRTSGHLPCSNPGEGVMHSNFDSASTCCEPTSPRWAHCEVQVKRCIGRPKGCSVRHIGTVLALAMVTRQTRDSGTTRRSDGRLGLPSMPSASRSAERQEG